jgi:hypothetical protein
LRHSWIALGWQATGFVAVRGVALFLVGCAGTFRCSELVGLQALTGQVRDCYLAFPHRQRHAHPHTPTRGMHTQSSTHVLQHAHGAHARVGMRTHA